MIPEDIGAADFPKGSNTREVLEAIERRLNSPAEIRRREVHAMRLHYWLESAKYFAEEDRKSLRTK